MVVKTAPVSRVLSRRELRLLTDAANDGAMEVDGDVLQATLAMLTPGNSLAALSVRVLQCQSALLTSPELQMPSLTALHATEIMEFDEARHHAALAQRLATSDDWPLLTQLSL